MEEMKTNPQYKAIVCPNCGSKQIEFVTEYHKCIIARILSSLFLVICVISAVYVIKNSLIVVDDPGSGASTLWLILSLFAVFATQCYIIYNESKTHIQAVCRDCGNIWFLN